MIRVYMKLQDNNTYNYCTYLNSGLLEAPRKYVLHGLVPGLNWAHIPASPYEHASCCHTQPSIWLFIATAQVSHLAPSATVSGWLLTNVQVNITTMLHDTWHTCIYITLALQFIPSSYTSSILLSRLTVPDSVFFLSPRNTPPSKISEINGNNQEKPLNSNIFKKIWIIIFEVQKLDLNAYKIKLKNPT